MKKNFHLKTFEGVFALLAGVLFSVTFCATSPKPIDDFIIPGDEALPPCLSKGQVTFLRYKGDNQCYQANTRGPCNQNMVLYPHPASKKFAFCDCFDARSETKQEVSYLNNRVLSHCLPEIRSQLFVPERQRCYSVFDQGPCPDGKWLVLNATFYPVCANNTCLGSSVVSQNKNKPNPLAHQYVFAASTNGECHQTMTQGYCAKSYELRFSSNHFIPQCRYVPSVKKQCPTVVPEVRKLRCKPGSRYDFLTQCSRSISPRK